MSESKTANTAYGNNNPDRVRTSEEGANEAVQITTSDTVAQPLFRRIYVGVSGDVKITTIGGNVVVYKAAPVGYLKIACASLIWATGTTATNLVGES